jgi:outer membrane receptor protein involved in Fe transport
MASQTAEELGLRQELFDDRVSLTIAFFELLAQSETEYDPDIGQDFAGPGSRRDGYEINLTYQAQRWLEFYGSFSADHARYTSPLDDGTGHLGNYLPNAPSATGSFNIYIRNLGHWSGGIAYRYLGAFPLTSGPCVDSAVRTDFPGLTSCAQAPTTKGQLFGSGYGEWSADVRYAFGTGWSLGAAIFNLLDKKANAMEYFYVDRLPGEPSEGIADLHFHPLEPISARITVSKTF